MGRFIEGAVRFHEEETEFLKSLARISVSLLFITISNAVDGPIKSQTI